MNEIKKKLIRRDAETTVLYSMKYAQDENMLTAIEVISLNNE